MFHIDGNKNPIPAPNPARKPKAPPSPPLGGLAGQSPCTCFSWGEHLCPIHNRKTKPEGTNFVALDMLLEKIALIKERIPTMNKISIDFTQVGALCELNAVFEDTTIEDPEHALKITIHLPEGTENG